MRKLKKKKISTSLDTLCQGLNDSFKVFIQYARDLKFEDRPDYSYLKAILRKMCEKDQLTFNYNKYDWILKKEKAYEEQKEQKEQKEKENNKSNDNNTDNAKKSDDEN